MDYVVRKSLESSSHAYLQVNRMPKATRAYCREISVKIRMHRMPKNHPKSKRVAILYYMSRKHRKIQTDTTFFCAEKPPKDHWGWGSARGRIPGTEEQRLPEDQNKNEENITNRVKRCPLLASHNQSTTSRGSRGKRIIESMWS